MADAVRPDGVAQGLDDGLLADDLPECLGAPASVERLVRDGRRDDLLRSGANERNCRAPSVDLDATRAHRDERLGPGRSAAPDDDRLVLLPSGSDTVRGSPLRGTRSSTSRRRAAFENGDLGRGFSPAVADCRYRAPLVPRLARLRKDTRFSTPAETSRRGRARTRRAPGRSSGAGRSTGRTPPG